MNFIGNPQPGYGNANPSACLWIGTGRIPSSQSRITAGLIDMYPC